MRYLCEKDPISKFQFSSVQFYFKNKQSNRCKLYRENKNIYVDKKVYYLLFPRAVQKHYLGKVEK